MKILKLLSKFLLISILPIVLFKISFANEPIDIWKIEKKDKSQNKDINNIKSTEDKLIQGEKIKNQNEKIIVNQELDSKEIKLFGLYEPTDNGLSIDMWSNSDGNEIKEILNKIDEKKLSSISEEILDIVLLTNSYQPVKNISSKEFLDFKFNYLIKKKDFELIKKFLTKNPQMENNDKLVKFYTDFHLTISKLEKSCEIFEIVNKREKVIRVLMMAKSAIRHNMKEDLPKIKQNTCIIWGKNDKVTPPEVGQEFHDQIPNSELFWIDNCGHAPMIEKPIQFNQILIDWLKK